MKNIITPLLLFATCSFLSAQADYNLTITLPVKDTVFQVNEKYIDVESGVFVITARFNVQKIDSVFLEEKITEIQILDEAFDEARTERNAKRRELNKLLKKFGKAIEAAARRNE